MENKFKTRGSLKLRRSLKSQKPIRPCQSKQKKKTLINYFDLLLNLFIKFINLK